MNKLLLSSESNSGYTAVSDIFIDEYVPSANGEFVKIYLYLLRLLSNSEKRKDVSISTLADIFNQTENDVMRALRYWDKLGLVKLSYDSSSELNGITFKDIKGDDNHPIDPDNKKNSEAVNISTDASMSINNASTSNITDSSNVVPINRELFSAVESNRQQTTLKNVVPSSITASPEKLKELSDNDDFSMLLYAASAYLGKQLTESETNSIVFLYDTLHFPSDLIDYLFNYSISKGKTSIRYIETIALSWAEQGINTVEAAKEEVSNHDNAIYQVMKAFGLSNREPAAYERNLIFKWTDTYLFDVDMIIEACNRTIKSTHQPNFNYTDTILTNWHNANIKNADDIKKADDEHAANASYKSNVIKQNANRFNNFQSRPKKSEDWYNSLLSNNQ